MMLVTFEDETLPDGTAESVVVVHTDLEMNDRHPNYDATAHAELVEHVEAWQRPHSRRVTILGFSHS